MQAVNLAAALVAVLRQHALGRVQRAAWTFPLYQIALPATRLRRCGGLVMSVQAFDLIQFYDAIIPHNVG
jgi:hypothetical protein